MTDQETDDATVEGESAGVSADTSPPQSSADLLARVAAAKGTGSPDPVVQSIGDIGSVDGPSGQVFRRGRRVGRNPDGRRMTMSGARVPIKDWLPRTATRQPVGSTRSGGYRVRRVRRLLRHVEPWSVLKVTLVFYFCVWGLVAISTRMLWSAAEDAGTIAKIENFVEELFTLETFEFDSDQILRVFTLGGLVLVIGGTGVTVLLVVLFNLISDLMGGVRFTMIEEETAVRQRRLRHGDQELNEPMSAGSHSDSGQPD